MYEEREAMTLVICRVTVVVSCPQAIGDQPSLLQLHAIPHICQFRGTTTLFRPIQGAPKTAYIRDKIAKMGQNLAFSMLKGALA